MNETISKEERINNSNLRKIGFEIADNYIDPEIGYTIFKFKELELTIENKGWYIELIKKQEPIRLEGIKTISDIITLKKLIYG